MTIVTEGANDDAEVISCATEACKNGADCVDIDVGEVACFCLDGFEGDFCEISMLDVLLLLYYLSRPM